jgi:superfamily II DNA or RNA helicase
MFLDKFYTIKQQSYSTKNQPEDKVFVGKIKERGIYQFHTTQFVHLYQHLKEINQTLVLDDKVDERDYKTVSVDIEVREGWKLREHQVPAYNFLIDNPTKSKLIPLQTGAGKTSLSLIAIGHLKKRVAFVSLARFSDQWLLNIPQVLDVKASDIMYVQGSGNLRSLIAMAREDGVVNNYFVFSAETLQMYITNYEADPEKTEDEYGCTPMELFPLLGIGIMLNDESHLSFHSLYRIIIYTNVEYQIGLTATLITDDSTVRRMHRVVYPAKAIYDSGELNKYADVYPIAYSMSEPIRKMVKTSPYGSNSYSHLIFEQSLVKKDFLLRKYYKLIHSVVEDYYIEHYMTDDKLMIFVSTVDLATKLTSYLEEHYPDKKVVRYCQEDTYEDMLEGDIIVTTIISAGTGVDVPHLRICIQTVSVSSPASNIQSLGRLRELKDRDVKFCYLYCENIPKQKMYSLRRIDLFRDRVKGIFLRRSVVHFQ